MHNKETQTLSDDNIAPRVLSNTPLPESEFPKFLYQSHTVLWLLAVMGGLGYLSVTWDSADTAQNQKHGVLAAAAIVVFYSAVQLPSSKFFSRPHPALWRVLSGLGLCYLAGLMFLLFQSTSGARAVVNWFDPAIGVPLPERNYAEDCRVFTPESEVSSIANISEAFDVYIAAHSVGWFFKMIIIRDLRLCLFLSVLFEFLEVTLRHQLANFYECWWDSLLLDILLCNMAGIYLGYLVCSFSKAREYYWGIGVDNRHESGCFRTVSRAAVQFTPYSWSVYHWEMFASSKNFISTVWYIIFVSLVDLSNFYLKFVLWIPSSHWVLLCRVLFWAILAIISTREYYEYVESGFKIRLGSACWLSHLILFVEWLIVYKNSADLFPETMPGWLQFVWTAVTVSVLFTALYLFTRDVDKKNK